MSRSNGGTSLHCLRSHLFYVGLCVRLGTEQSVVVVSAQQQLAWSGCLRAVKAWILRLDLLLDDAQRLLFTHYLYLFSNFSSYFILIIQSL